MRINSFFINSVSFGIEVSGIYSNIDDAVMAFFGIDLLTSKIIQYTYFTEVIYDA